MVLTSLRNLIPVFIRKSGWTAIDTPREISGGHILPLVVFFRVYYRLYMPFLILWLGYDTPFLISLWGIKNFKENT